MKDPRKADCLHVVMSESEVGDLGRLPCFVISWCVGMKVEVHACRGLKVITPPGVSR